MSDSGLQLSTAGVHQAERGDRRPLVVVAYDNVQGSRGGPGWRWFEGDFPGVRWEFVSSAPSNLLERRVRRPMLLRTRCAWEAVRAARRGKARLLVSTEPELTYRCALMARAQRLRVPHVSWAFNYAGLPQGRLRAGLMRAGFRDVDRFVISSTMERDLYGQYFGIPAEKFDLHLWSVGDPEVTDPGTPSESGPYICAVGSNARDYRTLLRAMTLVPQVRLVLVTHPRAIEGLEIPPNVRVHCQIPMGMANNIIAHSRFAVLPLADGKTPNGHVTLVNTMKLGRATVITDSEGIADYAHDGVDALCCRPGSSESMAEAIRGLWDHPERAERLGIAARNFAMNHCAESNARDYVGQMLRNYGLLL